MQSVLFRPFCYFCLKRGSTRLLHKTSGVYLEIIDPVDRSAAHRNEQFYSPHNASIASSLPTTSSTSYLNVSWRRTLYHPSLPTVSYSLWTTFRSLSPRDLPVTEEDKKKKAERELKRERSQRSRMLAKRHLSCAPDTAKDWLEGGYFRTCLTHVDRHFV